MNYSQKRITRNDKLQSKEEGEANQSVESIVEASSQMVDDGSHPPVIIYTKTKGAEISTTMIGLQESGKAMFPGGKLITDESPEDYDDDQRSLA